MDGNYGIYTRFFHAKLERYVSTLRRLAENELFCDLSAPEKGAVLFTGQGDGEFQIRMQEISPSPCLGNMLILKDGNEIN